MGLAAVTAGAAGFFEDYCRQDGSGGERDWIYTATSEVHDYATAWEAADTSVLCTGLGVIMLQLLRHRYGIYLQI